MKSNGRHYLEMDQLSLTLIYSAKSSSNSGGVLESSGQADSKTVPGFDDWSRFKGVIEQNKISNFFCHYCIFLESKSQN